MPSRTPAMVDMTGPITPDPSRPVLIERTEIVNDDGEVVQIHERIKRLTA
jgi:hypothetical protein